MMLEKKILINLGLHSISELEKIIGYKNVVLDKNLFFYLDKKNCKKYNSCSFEKINFSHYIRRKKGKPKGYRVVLSKKNKTLSNQNSNPPGITDGSSFIKIRRDSLLRNTRKRMHSMSCKEFKRIERGHLLAECFKNYVPKALNFNFSRNNPDNIYPQWDFANATNKESKEIFGQHYFESIILNKLENGDDIYYEVEAIFKHDNFSFPVGNRLFARMNNTGEILFHVFVPNCFYRNPDIFKENSK